MKTQYFIFGKYASESYQNNGNINEILEKEIEHAVFKFEPSKNNASDLLFVYDGWESYAEITKKKYLKLTKKTD